MIICKQHYVGIKNLSDDEKLAFITPMGTDKAAVKRQDTVNQWLQWSNRGAPTETKVVDNVACSGFKIVGSVSRYTTDNKWVRIEDPRGYEVEISVANLVSLMSEVTVVNNEIKAECIWAREKTQNYLLVVDSAEYKQAQKEGVKHELKVGDVVEGHNTAELVYCGEFYIQHVCSYGDIVTKPDCQGYHSITTMKHDKVATVNIKKPVQIYQLLDKNDPKNWWLGREADPVHVAKTPMKVTRFIKHIDNYKFVPEDKLYKANIGIHVDENGKKVGSRHMGPKGYSSYVRIDTASITDSIDIGKYDAEEQRYEDYHIAYKEK